MSKTSVQLVPRPAVQIAVHAASPPPNAPTHRPGPALRPRSGAAPSSALTQQAVSSPRRPVPNERRRRRPPHGRRTGTTGEWPQATRGSPPTPAKDRPSDTSSPPREPSPNEACPNARNTVTFKEWGLSTIAAAKRVLFPISQRGYGGRRFRGFQKCARCDSPLLMPTHSGEA